MFGESVIQNLPEALFGLSRIVRRPLIHVRSRGCRTCDGLVHHVLPGLGKFKKAASAKRRGRENNKRLRSFVASQDSFIGGVPDNNREGSRPRGQDEA
jgi:hypothetical protein